MNVYLKPREATWTILRVADALSKYAPAHIQITDDIDSANLVVLHVIDYAETAAAVSRLISGDKLYAMLQYNLRSTQKPNTHDWLIFWQMAECVMSHYDLEQMLSDDRQMLVDDWGIPFHQAPIDSDIEDLKPHAQRFWEIVG